MMRRVRRPFTDEDAAKIMLGIAGLIGVGILILAWGLRHG